MPTVVTATPSLPQFPKCGKVQILPADASALKTAYPGGTNGSKVTGVVASSTDTAARDVQIGTFNTGTAIFYPLATVTIPANAGNLAGTPPVNLLAPAVIPGLPLDSDGNPYIFLIDGNDSVQVKALTTVTAAKAISINSIGGDF